MKKIFCIFTLFLGVFGFAQLSDLHYLPPLKQGLNNQAIQQQAVYLSTPEPTTFVVNAYLGTSTTAIATFNISNVSPAVYTLANGDNNITLVNNANTGVVLNNSGLRFESPSGNKFYVNYRGNSANQAASLTSKGRAAIGTHFKWGGVPNLGPHPSKSNTLGIMATEDNTTVTLSGYDPDCEFRVGNNVAGITANTYTITLNANESFVFENYRGNNPTAANSYGWIGADIISDKDIVISNGSMNFGRKTNSGYRDAGIDQPIPENKLGKEYVFVRGNGNADGLTEFPLLIATADNTQIFINGSTVPTTTLNNGDFFEVPSSNYSSNTVGANMYIQTSKNVYAYQCVAGSSDVYTQGLNFVAPVNCLLPDVMDNIPDIRNMAGVDVTGGLTIIAATNTPDANILVTNGNGAVTLPPSNPVAGSADWKTFFIPNLNGNVSVQSTGPMAVGFFGYNGAKGVAGYFSGFDTVPEVSLEIRGGTGCFVGSEIYESSGNFDAYQWFENGVAIPGANSPDYSPPGAGEYFLRGTKGPCTYDSNTIKALYCDPDIVVKKSVDKPEIMEGETATFTIRIKNSGIGPLTNLQITDNIPAGLTLESNYTINGSWSGNTWNIGTLNGGEIAILELRVRGDEIDTLPLVNLTNTVTHTQDQIDANISEDIPSASIIVHNDFDKDGVRDITDLDDDNDGIYDSDECSTNICFENSVNESFENPVIPGASYGLLDENDVPGWLTTATDGYIELWSNNFLGVPSYDGNQFAELNAYQNSALYQNLCLTPGTVMNWSLRHRGREGTDVMRVRIGADLVSATEQAIMSDDNTAWGLYSGTYAVPLGQTNTVFIFEAVSTHGGHLSVGNLIDDIKITIEDVPLCQDSDNDGLPDSLDLDSDGDGCSDANEFYKNNVDGGDDGVYGLGTPSVDPNNGTVIGASYNQILAPEILLGNAPEDLGGNDINGQDVSLGQTLEYVLRFQNTGDDNAVNYTIRDILPSNVTFNTVDISNAPGVTYNHDPISNEITFQVPNGLVEVGDPEYRIRIEVTIASNCSEFVAACSSQLENRAYSTYTGTVNTNTFSDEPGNEPISVCANAPEVATNSIFNALATCNQARTVQLCGDDVVLTAGAGFMTYTWYLDSNGNGIVDNGETELNDGNADNDASTLYVTAIGNYIVEKTTDGSCPNAVERIKVERFGETQTNPVIAYVNDVNTDANPDNDVQGEVVTCSIDGDLLQKIFLCGADDEVTIQLGITDAQSIVWEKLDEGSCDANGKDCANKNGDCTWTTVATQDNFTASDSGEYRVVINYQNGCYSRFYFNVFKNDLELQHISSDILCNTLGTIRITNVGSGYGFQLVDVTTDNILIPYSANNGPNFDINTNGTYKVQVTQLNPDDGTPIAGSCIFETEDIGIQERNFSTEITTVAAACGNLGSITVQALNALPNYSYELRLNDGSNGGDGSLISNIPPQNDNTHTFENLNDGNYFVITKTQDGCFDSKEITVEKTPKLKLSGVTSQDISCTAGIINLTATGGVENTTYHMAIWSKDGTDLYSSPNDITADALQSTTEFLFNEPIEAGEYEFIVFDDSGCYAMSNSIKIIDLGKLVITATNSTITCADSATATLTVNVTGGTAPYSYSLDGDNNYQSNNTFYNLSAGIHTISVKDSNNNPCLATLYYEINQPFGLSASPSILEDASCDPNGALVKILNPNGGQAPYTYSFNGGSSFSTINTARLVQGTYQLILKDALECTYDMEITVPDPITDPTFNQAVTYNCLGEGTIAITPSNTTDFKYTYSLNGTLNTPSDNASFTNVAAGTQTVTVTYANAIAPNQSTVFLENFGAGPNTKIGEIGPGYCYEPQDGSTTACNLGPAGILVDGEYSVTSFVTNPIPAYRNPNDHSAMANGRFLSINPSNNLVGSNSIIWERKNIEVLPNRDMVISFWAYNLRQTGFSGNNPEIEIELLDASGTIINSMVLPEIPKNTNADDWHNRTVTFNPGANSVVAIVLRSNQTSDDANELILDDIQATQQPDICEKSTDITVVVASGKAFDASLISTIDPSCYGGSNGAIRFEVTNFDPATGFEYSTNGGGVWTSSLVSPVTTTANLISGNYTVQVRKVSNTSCTTNFTATLNDPTQITPSLTQKADYSCLNTGATLEASATGGSPSYQYQLETTVGTVVRAYQTNQQFTNVPEGNYLVRVQDDNGCAVALPMANAITVDPPADIVFTAIPVACYSGSNDGSITVDVTAGNGKYQFRRDGGAWMTPTPATATTYTFNGLSEGSYSIEVRDQLGCPATANTQTITINPQLVVGVVVDEISSCGDGTITVNATGGNGTLVYAIVPADTDPTGTFSTTNSLTVTDAMATANPGGYDVYVQDNNGSSSLCNFLKEDIILNPSTPFSVTAVPTDPQCFDGLGQIDVTVSGGKAPFTYTLSDLTTGDGIDYGRSNSNISDTNLSFYGIGTGSYEITITDQNSCTTTKSATITNAVEITAQITPILPANCTSSIESDFGFEFQSVVTPAGTVAYSNDGGSTWQASPELRGSLANPTFSGTEVFPSIRVEVSPGVYCQKDFNRYIIPFPLDDLDITLSAIVIGCNNLQVTVEGSKGDDTGGYDYTYTDDPANFNTFISNPNVNVWVDNVPKGTSHTFANFDPNTPQYPGVPLLIPGRTYVFYVRDGSGCIRQSNVNVNEIPMVNLPIEITSDVTPTCSGATTGEITFTINPDTYYPNFRWEIYELGTATAIETSGGNVPFTNSITSTVPLGKGEYYIEVTQIESDNTTEVCKGASENIYLEELASISATATVARDISCNLPGLISITGITGGGGHPYTYDVNGPAGFTLTGTTDNPVEIPVNSPAGDYTVTLYDQYSCPAVLNTVTLSLAPNPTLTVAIDNCTSPNTVTVTGSSAAGNLRYAMVANGNPAPTTFEDNAGIFTNVAPGTYDFYVTDGNGCINSELAFVVHPALSASASLSKLIDCTGSPEAAITIDVTNGSGTYEYSITNTAGAPAVTITNIPSNTFDYTTALPGDYTITIYDANTPNNAQCNRVFTVTVPNRVEPVIDPSIITKDVSCIGNTDGSITIATTSGDAAPYTFEITSMDGVATSILPASTTGTSATFTGLAPTTTAAGYIVTVTGDPATNNCSVNSGSIKINEPAAISFNASLSTAFGCTSGNTTENAIVEIDLSSITGGSNSYTRYQFIEVSTGNELQNGSNNTYTYTNLAGDDILVRVYDDNGCVGDQTVNVPEFDALGTPTVTVDNAISCSYIGENISIDIVSAVTNFTANPGNYEFRQLPAGTFQASNQFTNLQTGSYTFVVRNIATGCETTVTHSVADPNTMELTVNKIADVICFGDTGSINLTVSDASYAGGFTWSVFNTNNTPADRSDDGTAVATGTMGTVGTSPNIDLPAGNYLVEVTQDAFPSCGEVRSFNINTPEAPLTLDTIALEEVGCSNDQGSAAIRPLGGKAPYDIQLTNTTTNEVWNAVGANAHLFPALTAGQYSIMITDALGCPQSFANEFELVLPDPILGTVTVNGLVCQGDNDASIRITLNPRNISSQYRFRLKTYSDMTGTTLTSTSTSQTLDTFNNLGAGFYSISVADDMGCSYESEITEISDPTEVTAQLLTQQALGCQTGATLELIAQGGTAPYTWSTDGLTFNPMNSLNGANTHVFQNMTAGTYQYYVRDSYNCVSILSNQIPIAPIVNLTVAVDRSAAIINCNGEGTAVIDAKANGGLGDYEYALYADAGLSTIISPYKANGLFTNLGEGMYYVHVRSGDCEVLSQVIDITEPEVLTVVPDISNVQCFGDVNGSISLDAQGGTGPYTYAISPNLNHFDDNNTFDELAPGDYSVIVQDSKGCFWYDEFTIEAPLALEIEPSSTSEICAGDENGSISVVVTGGTAPYSTALNSNDDADFVEGRLTIENLSGDTYILFVKDANGCITNQNVTVATGANLNAMPEVVYECTGSTPNNAINLVLEDDSIANDVMYALDANDYVLESNFTNLSPGNHSITIAHANGCINTIEFMVDSFEPLELILEQRNLNEITAIASGGKEGYTFYFDDRNNGDDNTLLITRTDNYTVRVVDANGCEAVATIYMEFIDIEIPNFFTPDGDGKHDVWKPRNIEQYPNIFIKIFDRYGREIYLMGNSDGGWDGLYQEMDLPTGDYWYNIKLNGEEDQREFIGHFTLYR